MMHTKLNRLAAVIALASLGLTACGGGSDSDTTTPPAPTPSNSAPTAITLSAAEITENVAGAVVGELSATDADSGDTHTFSVEDERFEVSGSSLKLKDDVSLDFEQVPAVELTVTVSDSAGASFSQALTLNVVDELDFYAFDSAFIEGESSVSYSGQTARQVLISDLNSYIGAELGDVNSVTIDASEFNQIFTSYFEVPKEGATGYEAVFGDGGREILTSTTPAAKQSFLTEISSSHKDLKGKLAGNDGAVGSSTVTQHKDWNNGAFVGWGTPGSTTPEALVRTWVAEIAANIDTNAGGTVRQNPLGEDITKLYVTEDGRDLQQLLQKFLSMAVAYSQAADDYLDADVAGKGLLASNVDTDCGGKCTVLEHQFDEGFGYFGAARDYLSYTDKEIAGKSGRDDWQGHHDSNEDGVIDFTSEFNFGHSTNAAKRDSGNASNTNPTDYTAQAMNAFLAGRKIINDAAGQDLSEAEMAALLEQRDEALDAWEKAIVATVIHYINDGRDDLDKLKAKLTDGTDGFSYTDTAKHWSEMKGFALGLQFNPHSALSDEDFSQLHTLLADAPVMDTAENIESYRAALLEARDLLQEAYDFDAENVEKW